MIRRICCAFSDPGLLELLHQHSVTEIEIIGIDGCCCVASSAVDACKSGFHVTLPCEFIGVRNMAKFEEKKETHILLPLLWKTRKTQGSPRTALRVYSPADYYFRKNNRKSEIDRFLERPRLSPSEMSHSYIIYLPASKRLRL